MLASVTAISFVVPPSAVSVVMVRAGGPALRMVDEAAAAGAGEAAVWDEGLSIRVRVDPEAIEYSFTSFVSTNALPLSSNRWVSGEGAEEDDWETSVFRWETASVI